MEHEILEYIKYGVWILFGSGVVFEITPFIKWNPVSSVLGWVGSKLNRDIKKDVLQLQIDVKTVQSDLQEHKVESWRRDVLDFANKLRLDDGKTQEDYNAIIKSHNRYVKYIEANNIENGEIDLAYKYISDTFNQCMKTNSFYTGK